MQESGFVIAVKRPNLCIKPKENRAFPVMNHTEFDWDLLAETLIWQELTVTCIIK